MFWCRRIVDLDHIRHEKAKQGHNWTYQQEDRVEAHRTAHDTEEEDKSELKYVREQKGRGRYNESTAAMRAGVGRPNLARKLTFGILHNVGINNRDPRWSKKVKKI
jgi:DNA-binding NtrC family response regulator